MKLFEGDRRIRLFVFFSGGASAYRYLRDHDPAYGDSYEVIGAFTDNPDADGIEIFEEDEIPLVTRDIKKFYSERDADIRDLDIRELFDEGTLQEVYKYEPDLILLSGYMRILTSPVVEEYSIINVHPADLRIQEEGERKYTGFDAVFDAIEQGEEETRSSVHLVTDEVDDGPLITVSRPFRVNRDLVETLTEHGVDDELRGYVDAHQEWMKWRGDGPVVAKAIELISNGEVAFSGGELFISGESGPYIMES